MKSTLEPYCVFSFFFFKSFFHLKFRHTKKYLKKDYIFKLFITSFVFLYVNPWNLFVIFVIDR